MRGDESVGKNLRIGLQRRARVKLKRRNLDCESFENVDPSRSGRLLKASNGSVLMLVGEISTGFYGGARHLTDLSAVMQSIQLKPKVRGALRTGRHSL